MTTTPWGKAQSQRQIAQGITRFDTASHGGYRLSEARLNEMPDELRRIEPYAGSSWYEEDCDWAIVVLAFPQHFDDYAVLCAVETATGTIPNWIDVTRAYLEQHQRGRDVMRRAQAFRREHRSEFRQGGSSTGGQGWTVGCTNFAGTESLTVEFPKRDAQDAGGNWQGFYALPAFFPESKIAELGGRIVKREVL